MVLKVKIFILIIFLSNNVFASENGDIFYTDKYDANYFSSENTQNTKLYFGSDLFKFLDKDAMQTCGLFIESFLRNENITFDINFNLENENRLKISLKSLNAEECRKLSIKWSEEYKIDFQKLLFNRVDEIDFNSIKLNADKIIFKKLIKDEQTRFYNPGNNVNNINLAFVIPKSLSKNNFKKVFTHHNTKRYSSRESKLSTTEILYNNELKNDQIKYIFPSLNKQSFLKNCISLSIIESIYKEVLAFTIDYNINQCNTSFIVSASQTNITDFTVFFNKLDFDDNQLYKLKKEAVNNIKKMCSESLFYYSYYDIEKLKTILDNYDLNMLNAEFNSLNERSKFILEVSENSHLYFKKNKIQSYKLLDFKNQILSKRNSADFVNETDTTLINKLKLFMLINQNYSLNIIGSSQPNEYLFIEKAKRDSFLNKFTEQGYRISRRKDLALYRALLVFSELSDSKIESNRLSCIGRKAKTPKIEFVLTIDD